MEPNSEVNAQLEQLRKERDYYRRQADELAAQSVKQDYSISSLQYALTQKRQGLALLSELHQSTGLLTDLDEMFRQVLDGIVSRAGMTRVVAFLPGEDPLVFLPAHWTGYRGDCPIPALPLEVSEGWLERGQPLLVNKATPPLELTDFVREAYGIRYFILMPILVGDVPVGLLLAGRDVERKPFAPPLDEGDVDTLRAVAMMISAFVHHSQVRALRQDNEQLRQLAIMDKLTGIPNRRHFDEMLAQEWKRCSRRGNPLALFMLDVDHFKRWNDTHGHAVGDLVLVQVARHLSNGLRPGDVGARYGGEEFAVLLPETDQFGAAAVAERIRLTVAEAVMKGAAGQEYGRLTVSIGVAATVPGDNTHPAHLMQAADQSLYEAKNSGRNRVVVATRHTSPPS